MKTKTVDIPGTKQYKIDGAWTKAKSCASCRQKKRKCSRETPICSYCKAHGHQCVYQQQRQKKQKKECSVVKPWKVEIDELTSTLDLRSQKSESTDMSLKEQAKLLVGLGTPNGQNFVKVTHSDSTESFNTQTSDQREPDLNSNTTSQLKTIPISSLTKRNSLPVMKYNSPSSLARFLNDPVPPAMSVTLSGSSSYPSVPIPLSNMASEKSHNYHSRTVTKSNLDASMKLPPIKRQKLETQLQDSKASAHNLNSLDLSNRAHELRKKLPGTAESTKPTIKMENVNKNFWPNIIFPTNGNSASFDSQFKLTPQMRDGPVWQTLCRKRKSLTCCLQDIPIQFIASFLFLT
ncbi:unnamed protein product [Ambrosiozyma monospora]|uniref:Unnamed protein product n=1 Tax=Ambrosiozyma monospora TaxID=43982 RepID=A0ACB5TAX2_AMBMO|nr:unnamed protein product [Ambrosiozyma monospora]